MTMYADDAAIYERAQDGDEGARNSVNNVPTETDCGRKLATSGCNTFPAK